MVGYVIMTRGGLTADQEGRAAALGPSCVTGFDSPAELAGTAGMTVIHQQDVTERFRDTCAALLEARRELEAELRHEEGDVTYDDELARKRDMLRGIDDSLLVRSLITAIREP